MKFYLLKVYCSLDPTILPKHRFFSSRKDCLSRYPAKKNLLIPFSRQSISLILPFRPPKNAHPAIQPENPLCFAFLQDRLSRLSGKSLLRKLVHPHQKFYCFSRKIIEILSFKQKSRTPFHGVNQPLIPLSRQKNCLSCYPANENGYHAIAANLLGDP